MFAVFVCSCVGWKPFSGYFYDLRQWFEQNATIVIWLWWNECYCVLRCIARHDHLTCSTVLELTTRPTLSLLLRFPRYPIGCGCFVLKSDCTDLQEVTNSHTDYREFHTSTEQEKPFGYFTRCQETDAENHSVNTQHEVKEKQTHDRHRACSVTVMSERSCKVRLREERNWSEGIERWREKYYWTTCHPEAW